jgi:hypothetical protein
MFVGCVCVCVYFVAFFVFVPSFVCEYVTQCATHWINNAPRPVSIPLCSNDIAFYPDT